MTKEIEKAIASRVILIMGNEERLRREALASLLVGLEIGEDDFDSESVMADTKSPMEWVGSASTSPFLSKYRTVIVRHILRLGSLEDFALEGPSLLPAIPESGRLILVADDESTTDDSRQKKLAGYAKQWEKIVKAVGGSIVSCSVDPKSFVKLLQDASKEVGKTLVPTAATVLVEMCGGSYSNARDEVEKLAIYVGDNKTITESDVHAVVVPNREWNVFKLVDAALDRKASEAIRQLRILLAGKTKAQEAGIVNILPQLSSNLRLLWQARSCLDLKVNPTNAPSSLTDGWPAKPNLAKEIEWKQRKIMNLAQRVTLDQLAGCFVLVADADAALKGQFEGSDGAEILEMLVLRLVQLLESRAAVGAR